MFKKGKVTKFLVDTGILLAGWLAEFCGEGYSESGMFPLIN